MINLLLWAERSRKLRLMAKEISTKNSEETQKIGESFVKSIKKKNGRKAIIVALEGDLGGGKTTFAQGLARGLRLKDSITSPSFVLIKKYQLKEKNCKIENLYHIDCYHLNKSWQLQELGLEEIINDPKNLVVIEWAERVEEILPKDKTVIKFEWVDENKRKITFNNK